MVELLSRLLEIQLVRFVVAGGMATLVYYVIFIGSMKFAKVKYDRASVYAFVPSFALNFVLQKLWAFRSANLDDAIAQLGFFSLKNVILFWVNYMLLRALVEHGKLRPLYAQIALTVVLTVASYFASRWIFSG